MVPLFGCNPIEFSLIFYEVLDFIYQHPHRFQSWNFNFLQPYFWQNYADVIALNNTPLNIFFVLLVILLLVFLDTLKSQKSV